MAIRSRRNSIAPETLSIRSRQNSLTSTVVDEVILQARPNTLAIGELFPEEEQETEEKETEMSDWDTKSTLKCVGKSNILVQNFITRLQSTKSQLILYSFLLQKLGYKRNFNRQKCYLCLNLFKVYQELLRNTKEIFSILAFQYILEC